MRLLAQPQQVDDPFVALETLQSEVRKYPSNAVLRNQLFNILCVLGDWTRASIQLDVIGELAPGGELALTVGRALLQCEKSREAVFSGVETPQVMGDPPDWLVCMVEVQKISDMSAHRVVELIERAFERAPTTGVRVNERTFSWLADGDCCIGPMAELYVNGHYYWVPFEQIKSINFHAPRDLRDLVWAGANIVWRNGGEAVGFMPVRYAATVAQRDPEHLMARKTHWDLIGADPEGQYYTGVGQRMFCSDSEDFSLLDVETIEFVAEGGQ